MSNFKRDVISQLHSFERLTIGITERYQNYFSFLLKYCN